MITIQNQTWNVREIIETSKNGNLNISPSYQRHQVWKEEDKILLIDSLVRRLPIGTITLFKETDSDGLDKYQVIDGQQRLTAIRDYLNNAFPLRSSAITKAIEKDEDERDQKDLGAAFYDKKWSELSETQQIRIFQYPLPVLIMDGTQEDAVYAFYRMNKTNYVLKPQEIRNAIFNNTKFLETVKSLEARLSKDLGEGKSFLKAIGAISDQQFKRMQDLQLLSELLILILRGPQHRRDSLDRFYRDYRDSGLKELEQASTELYQILEQLFAIFEKKRLNSWHFPPNCEHDLYALVGALHNRRPMTNTQLTHFGKELAQALSEFQREVTLFRTIARTRSTRTHDLSQFPPNVDEYGRTFLGGQINSKDRREARIRILTEIFNDVCSSPDPNRSFKEWERRYIWASSQDKVCARCGERVEWKDFHAGHKIPHAKGGKTTIENGQIEHSWCNQSAGASG
jgi:hypothetical protein